MIGITFYNNNHYFITKLPISIYLLTIKLKI